MTNYKSSPTGRFLLSLFTTTKTVAAVTFSAFKVQIVIFNAVVDVLPNFDFILQAEPLGFEFVKTHKGIVADFCIFSNVIFTITHNFRSPYWLCTSGLFCPSIH